MRVIARCVLKIVGGRRAPGLARGFAAGVMLALLPDALGQFTSPVYMDDSPGATEALSRSQDLAGVGNLSEAAAVLQRVLEEFPSAVVSAERAGDDDLFVGVRRRVHELLIGNRPLLDKYRESENDNAARALKAGRAGDVEAFRLLTTAGFDAALLVAEDHLENARFDAALLTLEQLEQHPDRNGERSAKAAELLTRIARYRASGADAPVWRWVERWRQEAGLGATAHDAAERPLQWTALTPFDGVGPVSFEGLLAKPLASERIGEPIDALKSLGAQSAPRDVLDTAVILNSSPTVSGDTVFVNDSERVSAWDRFTLTLKWRQHIDAPPSLNSPMLPPSMLEDMTRVAVQEPWAVAVTGLSLLGRQTPERTVTAFDTRTGDALWSRTLIQMNPTLDESMLRGGAVIDQGTVVVAAVKQSQQKRLVGVYLVGLDLVTGETRWTRTLASIGSLPWASWRIGAGDESTVSDGTVFRADRLGVFGAVESFTGRPRWVRRIAPDSNQQPGTVSPAWQANIPQLRDGRLYTMSPDRREVLALDAASGAVVRRMPGQRLGSPDYVLLAGDLLIGVSANKVRAIDLKTDSWGEAPVISIADFTGSGLRGRVIIAGDQLIFPVIDGIRVASLSSPQNGASEVIKLESPGTVLAMESQLLVVDDERLHSYLLWDVAEKLLRERMAAGPNDPEPAITYAELSHQAGKVDRVLPAVDTALAIIEKDPLKQPHDRSRARLFRALLDMVEPDARTALTARLSVAQRRAIIDRLGRAAADPSEQVSYRMASARAFEAEDQARAAVEQYQEILETPVLASQTFTSRQTTLPADVEATRRLRDLVRANGSEVYAAYEQEATRRLEDAGATAPAEQLESIARRYPLSRAAARAWAAAAERYRADERPDPTIFALEEGLRVAGEALPAGDPLFGELAGKLVLEQERAGRIVPAIRGLESLARERPGTPITNNGTVLDRDALLAKLRERLASAQRRPNIGNRLGEATAIPGWAVIDPACGEIAGAPANAVVMSSAEAETSMFRISADARSEKLWADLKLELYLFIDADSVYFGRATAEDRALPDQVVVRRDITTGKARWATRPFRSIFGEDPGPRNSRALTQFETPLKPSVSVNELFTMLDNGVLILVERTGRVAAFNAETGDLMWSKSTTMSRVYDAALEAGRLVIGGEDEAPSPRSPLETEMRHTLLAIEARTGQVLFRHEDPRTIRWVRVTPEGHALVGLDSGLASFDVFRKVVRWRSESDPLEQSIEAWATPGRIVVRNRDDDLWGINADTGERDPQPLDAHGRLDNGYLRVIAQPLGDRFAVATMRGFAIFDNTGTLVAADARSGDTLSLAPAFGEKTVVTIEPVQSEVEEQAESLNRYTLSLYDLETGRAITSTDLALISSPISLTLVDGAILVSAGSATVVVPAPAGP